MKIKDVHFDGEPDRFGQEFQRECLLNWWQGKEYENTVKKIIRKANNMDELIELVLNNEYMKHTQAYAEISKRSRSKGHWYRIREMFGEKQFKTFSDAGGVKVGNEDFNFVIHNGRGDGVTRVAVFDDANEFNEDMMRWEVGLSGARYNIYSFDCDNVVERTLEGEYNVYSYDGFVAFVKIKREI
jgi:hypothetical protein